MRPATWRAPRSRRRFCSLPIVYGLDQLVESAIVALKRVNHELIALAASNSAQRTIGSTVVGLAIADGQYRCFWAGDSRAYRVRDGQIIQLTRDHSLVQDLVDAGMLEPEEAENHPNANVITRAVGVAEELKIDIVSGDAQARRSIPSGQRRFDEAGRATRNWPRNLRPIRPPKRPRS